MRHILLPVKRSFNVRAYLILVGLLIPAEIAIQPYALTITNNTNPKIWKLVIAAGFDLLLIAVLGAAGLWFASRVGLGMPFIEDSAKRESVWNRLPGVMGMSILAGIVAAFLVIGISIGTSPLMKHVNEILAERYPTGQMDPPAWQGLLAAFSAGVTEETMFRLFGLTLLAWLGSLLFRSQTGRPAAWLLWTGNILFAILFGLAHLPLTSQIGIPLDAVVVINTIILNGVAGVIFGWLYWSFGLESAMLAHMSAYVVLHGFLPLVTQQADPTRSSIAGVIVVLLTVLACVWSIREIVRDRRQFLLSINSDSLQQTRESFSHPSV